MRHGKTWPRFNNVRYICKLFFYVKAIQGRVHKAYSRIVNTLRKEYKRMVLFFFWKVIIEGIEQRQEA